MAAPKKAASKDAADQMTVELAHPDREDTIEVREQDVRLYMTQGWHEPGKGPDDEPSPVTPEPGADAPTRTAPASPSAAK